MYYREWLTTARLLRGETVKFLNKMFLKLFVSPGELWVYQILSWFTLCLQPCESTNWPALSSPDFHKWRSAEGNVSWPLLHSVFPGEPHAGSACPLPHWALGYQSEAQGRKGWLAAESGSAGRGKLWCMCPSVGIKKHKWKKRMYLLAVWHSKYSFIYQLLFDSNYMYMLSIACLFNLTVL